MRGSLLATCFIPESKKGMIINNDHAFLKRKFIIPLRKERVTLYLEACPDSQSESVLIGYACHCVNSSLFSEIGVGSCE